MSFGKEYTALVLKEFFKDDNQVVLHTGSAMAIERIEIDEENGDKIWTDGAILREKTGRYMSVPKNLKGFYNVVGASVCVIKKKGQKPIIHYVGNQGDINISGISHVDLID